jgi:hypothetical protein
MIHRSKITFQVLTTIIIYSAGGLLASSFSQYAQSNNSEISLDSSTEINQKLANLYPSI